MDPIQFIWEVSKALFALMSAVVLPMIVFWYIARHQRNKRDRNRSR